jgi:hypothetical protein
LQGSSGKNSVAERRRKLADYEVAGVISKNKLVPHGTKEDFSGVPPGHDDVRAMFQPQCGWLISGTPLE